MADKLHFFLIIFLLSLLTACQNRPELDYLFEEIEVEESKTPHVEKKLRTAYPVATQTLEQSGIYDSANEALSILQNATEALAEFTVDRRKAANWVEALDSGLIHPRADLANKTAMEVLDMNVLMTQTANMPHVLFPHRQHTLWLACSNCHDKIFIPKKNANPVTMNKVLRGQYCGVCHGKVSFSLFICERCHSVPHEGSGEKWW